MIHQSKPNLFANEIWSPISPDINQVTLILFLPIGKSSGGDPRSALLASIQQGTKLKKTTTVDKSGPVGAGRIADANGSGKTSAAPSRPPPPNNGTNGTLRGPFEGMSGMPKLKPVGGRSKCTSQCCEWNN